MYDAIERAIQNKKANNTTTKSTPSKATNSGGGFSAIRSAIERKDEIVSSSAKDDIEKLYNQYNELVGNAEKRYSQSGYRADYSEWKKQTSTSTSELSSASKKLRRNIDSYRTIYGDEYAD